MDPRQAAITTGQAYNIAAQLLARDPEYRYSDSTPQELTVIAQAVFPEILKAQQEAEAAASIGNAFPGTQQVAPASVPQATEPFPANVVQFPQQAAPAPVAPVAPVAQPQYQQPATAPAPIPGATGGSKKDALWQHLIANPGEWYDNRASKRNPNGPDFTRKSDREGLWLGGRYPAPAWVLQHFGVA